MNTTSSALKAKKQVVYNFSSPWGQIFSVCNILEFVRTHPQMFLSKHFFSSAGSKKYCRASQGLYNLSRKPVWFGWKPVTTIPHNHVNPINEGLIVGELRTNKDYTHKLRKIVLCSPTGQIFSICNLGAFILNNPLLFHPQHLKTKMNCRGWASSAARANLLDPRRSGWYGWKSLEQEFDQTLVNPFGEGIFFEEELVKNRNTLGNVRLRSEKMRMAIKCTQARGVGQQRAMDPADRWRAKEWRLRSPQNVVYRFKNLLNFVCTHKELFLEEDLKRNAASGLSALRPTNNYVHGSWKGWTWDSHIEGFYNGGEDLLDRVVKQ